MNTKSIKNLENKPVLTLDDRVKEALHSKNIEKGTKNQELKSLSEMTKKEVIEVLEKTLNKRDLECQEFHKQIENINTYLQSVEYEPHTEIDQKIQFVENIRLQRELNVLQSMYNWLCDFIGKKEKSASESDILQKFQTMQNTNAELMRSLEEKKRECSDKDKRCEDLTLHLSSISAYLESTEEPKSRNQATAHSSQEYELLERRVVELNYENIELSQKLKNLAQNRTHGHSTLSRFDEDLKTVRSERQEAFRIGASERMMTKVKHLDYQLEASNTANFRLKVGIFLLSAGLMSYVGYMNSVVFRETVKSIDLTAMQELAKVHFTSSINFLNHTYSNFAHTLRNINYGSHLPDIFRGIKPLIIGFIALKYCMNLPTYIKWIMNISNSRIGMLALSIMVASFIIRYSN